MKKEGEVRRGLRQKGKRYLVYCVEILFCVCLWSCMSVKYDMRKLEQPITMNGNPFVCDKQNRPSMKQIDYFSARVSSALIAASSPGQYQTQTTTQNMGANEAQAKAFERIGGDMSLTITDIQFNTESMGINLLFALASGVEISATGTVQQITPAVEICEEKAQ